MKGSFCNKRIYYIRNQEPCVEMQAEIEEYTSKRKYQDIDLVVPGILNLKLQSLPSFPR